MIRYITRPDTAAAVAARPRCVRSLEERMADEMRELAFAGDNVSVEALVARGWTRPTVLRLHEKAVAIARRKSVRQVA
ncbi:hypothetical protein [Mycoplana rhizolycopersici]|uniref:Uncharacterized protein n=1 Tax=Mycoplana rhizolycopersici TaxID=2746702 RepID=A0ABX2Q9T9_9HYPH|nr:hypothetical protein [Rhizobium rhizolycopersici]NVP54486.1 hypothetical protein [Rhizobium rhizolycopersici]